MSPSLNKVDDDYDHDHDHDHDGHDRDVDNVEVIFEQL